MSATALAAKQYPVRDGRQNLVRLYGETTIGASGAVGTQTVTDPGITFTRSSAGTYAIAYPAAPYALITPHIVVGDGTVIDCYCSARSPTAGTATIKFEDGAAPAVTDPENGAVIGVTIEAWTGYG